MFGWDWGAQLPDAGIFRDIEIQAYCTARIDEVKYQQEHAQGQVTLQVEAVLECADSMGKRSIGKIQEKKLLMKKLSMKRPPWKCACMSAGTSSGQTYHDNKR